MLWQATLVAHACEQAAGVLAVVFWSSMAPVRSMKPLRLHENLCVGTAAADVRVMERREAAIVVKRMLMCGCVMWLGKRCCV